VLSEDEKIQLSLIKDDLKMIDAGLNPLIMTRDERAQILKQIDESITKPMPVKNVDKKAGDKKGKKK
jgi:hypothetical protein